MSSTRTGHPARRTAEQTRELLLDTAITMLHERGPTAGVRHVRLSDVVERAGLTTGAAYRLWADQRAFHDELAIRAVRWRTRGSTEKTYALIDPIIAGGGPFQEVVRVGADANLQALPDDLAFLTTLALRASAPGQPALVQASHERHVEAMAEYGSMYSALITRYGRRFREPFTLEHLCAALAALAEGFGVQTASGEPHPVIDIPSADPRVGTRWSLLGVAGLAIIEHMTEPAPTG